MNFGAATTNYPDAQLVAYATVGDLSAERIDAFIEFHSAQGSTVVADNPSRQELLARLNIARDGKPTLAAVLVFGRYPQQFFPQLFIDVTTHPGLDKGSGNGGIRFLARRRCDGNLTQAVDDACDAVYRQLGTRFIEDAGTVREVKDVPAIAIREAVVNAVMHRDYAECHRGQQIAVDIYPDRVEVISPGGLCLDRTEGIIGDGRASSRNSVLVNLASTIADVEGKKLAENQGSGIPRMLAAMEKHGLPRPEFDDSKSCFKVTLPRCHRPMWQ